MAVVGRTSWEKSVGSKAFLLQPEALIQLKTQLILGIYIEGEESISMPENGKVESREEKKGEQEGLSGSPKVSVEFSLAGVRTSRFKEKYI